MKRGTHNMGLIIAIKENDHVMVGADSNHLIGAHESTFLNENNFKFWRVPGHSNVIMAYVGPYKRISNLLSASDMFKSVKFNFNSIVNEVVPQIVKMNQDNKLLKEDEYSILGRLIIATDTNLYVVEGEGFVREESSYVAIGSAKRNAYGSLRTSETMNIQSENRIISAITSSIEEDYKVSYPIIIGRTNSKKIDVIKKIVNYSFE